MKISIILIAAFIIGGCAINLPSVCDDNADPSRLCDMSAQTGVRLEDIGNGLIIANSIAIAEGRYTKQQALSVLTDLRLILDNPVSYLVFSGKVNYYVQEFPGLIQIAETYFDALGWLSQIMYPKDQEILKTFLDKQIKELSL